jgi:hypothetical protein
MISRELDTQILYKYSNVRGNVYQKGTKFVVISLQIQGYSAIVLTRDPFSHAAAFRMALIRLFKILNKGICVIAKWYVSC